MVLNDQIKKSTYFYFFLFFLLKSPKFIKHSPKIEAGHASLFKFSRINTLGDIFFSIFREITHLNLIP
jgi:hypothetical protein